MRINNEEGDKKPSSETIDPVCTPAEVFTGDMASSDCGERGLDQDQSPELCAEGGYHTFREASLDPQFSQGAAGLHISNDRHYNSSCSLSLASCREEGSSVRGRSRATTIGRENERGGDDSVAAEPETFPLSGGGYSPFSSASLISSESPNPTPKLPDTPLTINELGGDRSVGGDRSGQGASVTPTAGENGNDDDGGRGSPAQERCVPQSTSGELESRLDSVKAPFDSMKAPLENGDARRNGGPTPLSPDALTPFSRGDPEAKRRDR